MAPKVHPQEPGAYVNNGHNYRPVREVKSNSALRCTIEPSAVSGDNMNDSGYASVLATPERNSTSTVVGEDIKLSNPSNRTPHSHPIPQRLQELDNLLRFRSDIDAETENRYKDIEKVLEQPLYIFLRRKERNYSHQPISIRPMILGESYADAKPYIIVSCSKRYSERVKKFFKINWVKDLCEPDDEGLPRFKVYVVPRPTKLAAALVNALSQGISGTTKTNCGTLIEFNNDWGKSRATLGGLIKVIQPNGDYTLCGLTSGHSLMEDREDLVSVDDESDDRLLDDFEFLESPLLAGQYNETDSKEVLPSLDRELPAIDSKDVHTSMSGEQIGVAFMKMAVGYDERPCNYDWAIVQALSPSRYRPNLLRTPDSEEEVSASREVDLKLRDKPFETKEIVIVMAGASDCLRGLISPITTSLLLAPGTTAVKAYAVQFPDGSSLREGDSGSWVVSESTRQVIGHLSVLDAFGDAIVIPLAEILVDIQKELGAASVELPTTIDILSKWTQTTTASQSPRKRFISDRDDVDSSVYEPPQYSCPACPLDSGYVSAERSVQTSPYFSI